MTFILASIHKTGVYIGSDSRGSSSDHMFTDMAHKLIRIKNFVVGYTASYRTAQLIEFNKSKFIDINKRSDVFTFVETLKKIMIDAGNIEKSADKNELNHNDVCLLVATPKKLYQIYSNYQFDEVKRAGIGSGGRYGEGYFDALSQSDMQKRIYKTIDATGKRVTSVGGKTTVWKV